MIDTALLASIAQQMMSGRWGQLAREGRQVVQFKDSATNRFVAVSVEGEVTIYGVGQRE